MSAPEVETSECGRCRGTGRDAAHRKRGVRLFEQGKGAWCSLHGHVSREHGDCSACHGAGTIGDDGAAPVVATPRPRQHGYRKPRAATWQARIGTTPTEASVDREQAILDAIVRVTRERGYPPTVRELCVLVGVASTSTVQLHVERLLAKGSLRRDPTKPRTLIVVGMDSSDAIVAALARLDPVVPAGNRFRCALCDASTPKAALPTVEHTDDCPWRRAVAFCGGSVAADGS